MRNGTINQRQKGRLYERQARCYLERMGLIFITANVVIRGGEIDLIMRDQLTWTFIEVRYRASNHFGGALASVTTNKQRRLQHAAAVWLHQRGWSLQTTPCRFDIFAIMGTPAQCEWLPNAFNFDR